MPASSELIERSGDLKGELVAFGRKHFLKEFQRFTGGESGDLIIEDEGDLIYRIDAFILQHRLRDGRTVLEHFLKSRKDLPAAEREMLQGWAEVVEGVFRVERREGEALIAFNLVDELTYSVRSNMGPDAFRPLRPQAYLFARVVPVEDEWLISGAIQVFPPESSQEMYCLAGQLARQLPRLLFRNPRKLEQAWEIQRQHRERFIQFFGADVVALPGAELRERLREFVAYVREQIAGPGGERGAEIFERTYGQAAPEVDLLPEAFAAEPDVAAIYDQTQGLLFMKDYALVEEAFARPELLEEPARRAVVRDYLMDEDIPPAVLRRLAARDPERASLVVRRLLRKHRFDWETDGEALLREHKPEHYERPPLPAVVPLSEAILAAEQRAKRVEAAAAARVGRNDPCPCGSGKKYKRCCGR